MRYGLRLCVATVGIRRKYREGFKGHIEIRILKTATSQEHLQLAQVPNLTIFSAVLYVVLNFPQARQPWP